MSSAREQQCDGDLAVTERAARFLADGWTRFGHDPRIAAWAEAALPHARHAVQDPANAAMLRSGGTWFVGLEVLPNDTRGTIAGGPPLAGGVMEFIAGALGGAALALHRAQVSICWPGYPQPGPEESHKAWRFRVEHDAAHVDGLIPTGAKRRRFLREPHAWVLGLPLTPSDAGASPLVLWEGSHHRMRATFERCLAGHPVDSWESVDLTDAYQQTRREVFAQCTRVIVEAQPGEAFLLHRHLLHGVAPWREGAQATADGRAIAYFRPRLAGVERWLDRD